MSYQLKERPHKFSYSMNPIRYVVEVSNPDAAGSAVEFELYRLGISDEFNADTAPGTLVTTQTLFPDPAGKVEFYVNDFLNSQLEWDLPPIGDNSVQALTRQICRYYIRYRGITRVNPSPEWATESASIRTVIKGGVAKEKFDRNNYFISYLPAQKPFLTWQPDKHLIGAEERRYLTYFHHYNIDGVDYPSLVLKARIVYTNGDQETATKNFPSLGDSLLFHLPVGIGQMGLSIDAEKKLYYYVISVEDDEGNIYANPYYLYADYRPFYNVFSFIYNNSLGGLDTMRVKGDYDIDINYDKTDIQQAAIYGDDVNLLPVENAVVNISKYEVYKGDAGWQHTRAMQDSLQDLLLSDNVYRIIFNRWLRVVNLQKTQPLAATNETKFSFPLQWRYTFDNSSYTPYSADLGSGSSLAIDAPMYGVCTAPVDLVVTAGGEPGAFNLSWGEVGDAIGYELQYRKDDNPTWTTVPVDVNMASITLAIVGQYLWRVRTKCGDNDYSSYNNGPGFEYAVDTPVCDAPTNLSVSLLSLDMSANPPMASVKLNWDPVPGVAGYQVEYRQVGATLWATHSTTADEATFNFFALWQYEWRVRSKCNDSGDYSGYTYGENFIPSNLTGSCSPPSGLSAYVYFVTNYYGILFRFDWTQVGSATDYQLQLREVGTQNWLTYDHVHSPKIISFPGTSMNGKTWEWRLRSNCTAGGISVSVNGPNFNS